MYASSNVGSHMKIPFNILFKAMIIEPRRNYMPLWVFSKYLREALFCKGFSFQAFTSVDEKNTAQPVPRVDNDTQGGTQ